MNVTTGDLSLYLGAAVDDARGQFMLNQATALCESVVSPLPDAASVVVLSAAARAYSNPQGVTSETVGPFSVQRPWAGVYLTKSERATLRRMSTGSSGAFSVDPTPADAGPGRTWAQLPEDPNDLAANPYRGDFDWPA